MKNLGFTWIGGVAGATIGHFMTVPSWVLLLALAIGVAAWLWGAAE